MTSYSWLLNILTKEDTKGFKPIPKRWPVGVSDEGHIVQSVKVRPRPKDSSLVAWETPWRESKAVKLSDKILERRIGQTIRL